MNLKDGVIEYAIIENCVDTIIQGHEKYQKKKKKKKAKQSKDSKSNID